MYAQNTVCAKCALKTISDHTIPIRKWPLNRPKSDFCQTIVQPWPKRNPDHCADDCASQMASDQTILGQKMPLIRPSSKHLPTTPRPLSRRLCDNGPHQTQTIVLRILRVRWPLIRQSPNQKSHYSDQFLVARMRKGEGNTPKTYWKISKSCSCFWQYLTYFGSLTRRLPSRTDLWSDYPQTEVTSDHTIVHSKEAYDHTFPIRKPPLIIPCPDQKWPLMRPFPSGSNLWSENSPPEVASDQTVSVRKWPMLRPFPSGTNTHTL